MPQIDPSHSSNHPDNCRSCVDFKTWARQQRKSISTGEVSATTRCEIFLDFSLIKKF